MFRVEKSFLERKEGKISNCLVYLNKGSTITTMGLNPRVDCLVAVNNKISTTSYHSCLKGYTHDLKFCLW